MPHSDPLSLSIPRNIDNNSNTSINMPRNRRTRPELTESWEDVDDDYFNRPQDESLEEQDEDDEEIQLRVRRRDGRSNHNSEHRESPRTRTAARLAPEPELVMPRSPNGAANGSRSKTPRFRMNERSLTSDAGHFEMPKRARDQTPRVRMLDRSITSDAGKFVRRRSTRQDVILEDDDEEYVQRVKAPSKHSPDHTSRVWNHVFQPFLNYIREIIGLALHYAKPIIAYGLFAYLLVAAMIFGSNFLTTTINNALTPICRIPGVTTFFNPPFCPKIDVPQIAGHAEFDKLVQAQFAFEDILSASAYGVDLPLAMKRSEAGIRDLKNVVQYSNLPSKNELVFEFVGFVETAKQASEQLSKFNSRVGRAVDRILSTNRWTLNVINGIAESEANTGLIARFFENTNIFAPFQPINLSPDAILDQYLKHTSSVEEQITNLISEAETLLAILDNLDNRLDAISSIAHRDGVAVGESKDKLLASMWATLFNGHDIKRLNAKLDLLANVESYRKIAWAQVSTALVKLQAIRAYLDDLRERVTMPQNVGDKVPLEVHLEAINLGIERLEEQRKSSRTLEAESYRRVFDHADRADRAYAGDGRAIGDAGDGKFIGEKEL